MRSSSRGKSLLIVMVVLLAWLSGCDWGRGDGEAVELEVVAVERGSLVYSISAVGSVRARSEVVLSFEISGRIREILVQAGDPVRQGDTLAQLDSVDLGLQVRSAQAALAAAQAQLNQLQAGPREAEIRVAEGQVAAAQAALDQAIARRDQLSSGATQAELAAAQAAVNSAKATYSQVKAGPGAEEKAAAQAALDRATAALAQAQTAYDRVKGREDIGALPESLALQGATIDMEQAQANYDALLSHPTAAELAAAAAQVSQAEAHLAQLQASVEPQLRIAEAGVAAAQAQRDIAQAQLDLLTSDATAEQIAQAQAQVEQAQVAVDSALLTMQRAALVAPLDGIVALVHAEVGEYANPQIPAVTLFGRSQFSIEADVDEADIGGIEIGQEVEIDFDAFRSSTLGGKVVSIAPQASVDVGVVSYRVAIATDPTTLPLRAGMTANVAIIVDRREDVLLVPNMAIAIEAASGRKCVDRKVATGLERVEIETGLTTDEFSEVTAGLDEGDQVVVSSLSTRDQLREMMGQSLTGGGRQ